jgi:superoxide dismutase, Cu-Zn family
MPAKTFVPTLAVGAAVSLAAMVAWAQAPHATTGVPHAMMAGGTITKAIAVLQPTKDNPGVSGTVTFTQTGNGIQVVADIHGLTPGPHGFHIHEYGDPHSPDGMSAGSHFNPTGKPHAGPTSPARHVGDLGNIEADEKGHAKLDIVDPALSFAGPTSILGRGVVVHAKADDLKSQPAGNAGGRVAVGVIGVANPGPAVPATLPTPTPATRTTPK